MLLVSDIAATFTFIYLAYLKELLAIPYFLCWNNFGSSLFGVGVTGDTNPPGFQPSHLD